MFTKDQKEACNKAGSAEDGGPIVDPRVLFVLDTVFILMLGTSPSAAEVRLFVCLFDNKHYYQNVTVKSWLLACELCSTRRGCTSPALAV